MLDRIKKIEQKPLEPLVLRLLSAWCLCALGYVLFVGEDLTDLQAYADVPLWVFPLAYAASLGAVLWYSCRKKHPEKLKRCLPISFGLFSAASVRQHPDFYFVFILTALWAVLVFYYHARGWLRLKSPLTKKKQTVILWVAAAVFFAVVGGCGVMRYLAYRTPNYDFGIFAQMFQSMKTGLVPVTTCERDGALSHFAVHISPICYLLLPLYAVFSSPVTLQLSQAALLVSAVWPMRRLCRRFSLSSFATTAMTVLLLAYPAVAGGTNYDFHENCFLLPLLLWVFCLFEEERYLLMLIPAVLTLLVKEDAAVYIVFFALFVMLDRRQYLRGLGLMAGAGLYFAAALLLLKTYGTGVMEGRFGNFIMNDGGLAEAVKNAISNPGYAFTQLLVDNEEGYAEKMLFLLQMLVPLAFLPFCVRRVSRLTLLFPMVLINLLTVYPYQYQIDYQYSFGASAFVLYLSVLNLSELPHGTRKKILAVSLVCGALCFLANPVERMLIYSSSFFGNREQIRLIDETVRSLPEEASVCASAYLTPHLYRHETIYELYYHDPAPEERLDYVLLDMRFEHYEKYKKQYEKLGYAITKSVTYEDKEILVVMEWVGKDK